MKSIYIALLAIALTGCASDYKLYAQMQENIATANSAARIAEANAIAEIGKSGSEAAKVAAVLTLRSGSERQAQSSVQPPRSFGDQVFQWAGLLLPSIVQGYGIHAQTQLGMKQSDNSTALGMSTNNAFVSMASQIQAPAANVTTTTNTSIGGNGVIGSGSYAANPTSTVMSGTGVLGSGTYSTQANPISNANRNCTGTGAGSGSNNGTTTPQTGGGGSGSANC